MSSQQVVLIEIEVPAPLRIGVTNNFAKQHRNVHEQRIHDVVARAHGGVPALIFGQLWSAQRRPLAARATVEGLGECGGVRGRRIQHRRGIDICRFTMCLTAYRLIAKARANERIRVFGN